MLVDTTSNTAARSHWDEFYAGRKTGKHAPRYPSQFAAFAVNELIGIDTLIEFGCGNGRDSEFFGSYGLDVLAMDASAAAIEACKNGGASPQIEYRQVNVSEARPHVADFLKARNQRLPVAVYARFFLHAITPEEQSEFLDMLSQLLPRDSIALFEYRTVGDESDRKEFGKHYRRFLDHSGLLDSLVSRGFVVEYEIENRGLAKYRNEDAMVGRCVARKA
ncbi:MAG: class I SAM-dependent methyltransferase [Burkholderiaceae bacterium]|nr:class I SAM-dependent methyltransferase [Burkholderiaceae bacterium]